MITANEQLRREIEERKRAEKELKASEEKYRLLFRYDPNPLFLVDVDSGKILDVNNSAIATYQYERKELLEMPFWKLFDVDEAVRLWKDIHRFAEGEYISVPKLWARKKDGNHFFIDLRARGGSKGLGSGDLGEALIIRTVDITERLEREAQLIQASKMATLGLVATGVAHELNQPLSAMQVGADFFAKMIKRGQKISEEDLLKVSGNISEQVDRAGRIINHLREFGRKTEFELYPVDLNEPIRDVFTIVGQQLTVRNIEVELELDKALPKILGDKNRLEQIFLNLVTNARDAMDAKSPMAIKKLTITTYREGDRVVALVSDTGKGMPPQIQERIFAPFFTTKEVGKGTGLGLSICHNLVKDFKGDIGVESTLDIGTTFKISFPILKENR